MIPVAGKPACVFEYVHFGTDADVREDVQCGSRFTPSGSFIDYQTVKIVGECSKPNDGEKTMFHLIWYILIGLIAGVVAKSVMQVHLTIFWTIVLGIIGSIMGGAVTHMFLRPRNERYHPAGLIFSSLGAMLVLFICYKLNIHLPTVNLALR
jgi:uncharacterized membrane protein YeaQ/YmgE (transglycosylase-associated protein family)